MVKKFSIFIFIFILFICSVSFADDQEYLNLSDVNQFISAYNTRFNTSIVSISSIPSGTFIGVFLGHATSSNSFDLCLVRKANSTSYSLSTAQSSYINVTSNGGKDFLKCTFNGNSWESWGTSYLSTSSFKSSLLISSSLPIISNSSSVYYVYDFGTGVLEEKINSVTQEVMILDTKIINLQTTVQQNSDDIANLQDTANGVSEKLDTVIENQTVISDKIDQNCNRVIDTINSNGEQTRTTITQTGDKIIEYIDQDSNSTGEDFTKNFPSNEISDQTKETFDNIFTQISNTLTTSNPNASINVKLPDGSSTTISASQLSTSSSGLQLFSSSILMFSMSLVIIKDFRREIEKVKNGKIEQVANEDITANSL